MLHFIPSHFFTHKMYLKYFTSMNTKYIIYLPTHPAPQNAGQYFELPGSGQGLSSQPEAYEHDGRVQILQCSRFQFRHPALRGEIRWCITK
ncbi:TPA: hypothetical protein HMV82_08990 [Escherichia coli]|nr:hypothetical protein CNQ56_14320 [Escherichia coli]EAB6514997.1 hypothetical protein [Shigella flexneri]EFI90818.1 hypothetical protein HMPREF9551_00129 [Escherichia coli MS 196-1]EFJ79442.1 hypothetical protein HMPREF9534_04534 [Escherichia coli MS 69-1]EFO3096352.1 hypothetical protein [Escherichia coli O153]EFP9672006.1 hypothetical protein [Shigella sonnei]ESD87809.1 hypothetical protein HMPREF1611_01614 [Escherichia coli 908573]PSS40575.1 hypothetical protein BEM40_011050 [Escherichi